MTNAAKELLIRNEKGLAMVLALLLVTLLACFGMWLLLETHSGFRITSAYQRIEETFHLAEGACWKSIKLIDNSTIELPTTTPISDVTPSTLIPETLPDDPGKKITPGIKSARDFYNTVPPAGWMINWQGGSGYHRDYYLSRGKSEIQMPKSKGNSSSVLYNFAEKVAR